MDVQLEQLMEQKAKVTETLVNIKIIPKDIKRELETQKTHELSFVPATVNIMG